MRNLTLVGVLLLLPKAALAQVAVAVAPGRWITVALLLLASPLVGQELVPELVPGTRVRLTAPSISQEPFVATYHGRQDWRAVFTDEASEQSWTIPLYDLTKLAVYERKGRFWKGAGIGFATVTTVATILCAHADGPTQYFAELRFCTVEWSNFDALVLGSLVGLVVGFPLGGAIGALIRYDSWEPVELLAKPMVATHSTGRFSVGVSLPLRQ